MAGTRGLQGYGIPRLARLLAK